MKNRYVAFFRGLNIGGNNVVKMPELIALLESLDLRDVSSVLASGNLLFSSPRVKTETLSRKIGNAFAEKYGKSILVFVRTAEEIESLLALQPFGNGKQSTTSKHYATIIAAPLTEKIKLPLKTTDDLATIYSQRTTEICWVAHLTPKRNSAHCMTSIEKIVGKNSTTRSWNTIEKIANKLVV